MDSGRPKTSRGKQRPSPDEFADYVIPSPLNIRNNNLLSDFIPIHPSKTTSTTISTATITSNETNNNFNEEIIGQFGCFIFANAFRT